MKKALFYTVIFMALQAGVGAIVMAAWSMATGQKALGNTNCLIVSTTLVNLVVAALFLWLRWAEVSPRWIRTRPWTALVWAALASVGMLLPAVWLQEQLPELPNRIEQELSGLIASQWGYVVIGIMAPLVEELVFRGAVLRGLLQWRSERPWLCIAVSAALFAAVHMNPAQMPHAFCIGLLLGWMYYRTGSIVPGVVYHWVNNSIAFAVGHIMEGAGWDSDTVRLIDIFGSNARVMMAVGCSLLIVLPSLYQLSLRLKKA